MRVYYFAGLKDISGTAEEQIEKDLGTVEELLQWLHSKYPVLQDKSYMVAVNEQYASMDTCLQAEDVIALIPPVSGG